MLEWATTDETARRIGRKMFLKMMMRVRLGDVERLRAKWRAPG